jgi:transcriptional regulator with XRE-family HTH domain
MASRKATKKPVEPPADPLSPFLGPLLLRARQKAEMKQEVVASKAGMSDATLRKIENGLFSPQNEQLEAICKTVGLNQDVVLLEAATSLAQTLLERLGRDPDLDLHGLREKMIAIAKARHQLELEALETQLSWGSLLYLKAKEFVGRE